MLLRNRHMSKCGCHVQLRTHGSFHESVTDALVPYRSFGLTEHTVECASIEYDALLALGVGHDEDGQDGDHVLPAHHALNGTRHEFCYRLLREECPVICG